MLLVIHYLQTVPSPPVLPRLDPLTLRAEGDHVKGTPRKPGRADGRPSSPRNTQSLAELLLGFFAHYAALPMDQALCVATASYLPRPGSVRLCIPDPLASDEDLGCHLTPETLPVLRRELERARLQLTSGAAWAEVFDQVLVDGRVVRGCSAA